MTLRSFSFDDDDEHDLCVFSGQDLLTVHYDRADLDWQEVAERSMIDERRGLVITQVAVLEELVDESILYLEDPIDPAACQQRLDRKTIGLRIDLLERSLRRASALDQPAERLLADLRAVVARRNQLAHSTLHCRLRNARHPRELTTSGEAGVEWVLHDRRAQQTEPVSMKRLREDLYDAIGVCTHLIAFAERLVERTPRPRHFLGGAFIAAPTP